MQAIWERIETWLEQNAPEILADLQPSAADELLAQLEQAAQCTLPDDFRESYQIHDGSQGGAAPLLGEWQLLPMTHIIQQWSLQTQLLADGVFDDEACDPGDPIQPVWWDTLWIPIASNDSGDFCCLDLNPDVGGDVGQIISYWHTDPEREIIASSYRGWLEAFATDLEADAYGVDEDGWLTLS